jgi:hypothetical protein
MPTLEILARLEAAESEVKRLRADRDNAIDQIKKACPDYPWSENLEAPMSEAAWAASTSISGMRDALTDWKNKVVSLKALCREEAENVLDLPVHGHDYQLQDKKEAIAQRLKAAGEE